LFDPRAQQIKNKSPPKLLEIFLTRWNQLRRKGKRGLLSMLKLQWLEILW